MLINFVVGDWSHDGHEKHDSFIIKTASDITIEDVRQAHLDMKLKHDFEIGDICREYEDNKLSIIQVNKLIEIGFPLLEFLEMNAEELDEILDEDLGIAFWMASDIVDLWIELLNWINPKLKLSVVNIPVFHETEKNIKVPGYGIYT